MKKKKSLPSRIYSKKYYLTMCEGAEEFLEGGMSKRLKKALSLAEVKTGQKVLDVGCGRGELAVECAKRGADVWAIDYSLDSIALANNYLKRKENKELDERVNFKVMNAKKLKFPNHFFDRVFLVDILEHLYPEEMTKVLAEVKRTIKPGGRIVVYTPNKYLIAPVYFLAGLVVGWKKQKYHVNEQSYFSLKRNLAIFEGKVDVTFDKNRGYFSSGIKSSSLPDLIKRIVGAADFAIRDNPISSFIIFNTPLKIFLGGKMWAIVS